MSWSAAIRRAAMLVPAAAFLALAAPPALTTAGAAPPPPIGLQVQDGEDAWHPENRFRLDWTNPATGGEPPLVAVHYRVRDALGMVVVGERRIGEPVALIDNLFIPAVPGTYAADVWLEDASGTQGLAATAKLRFDNVRPGKASPLEAGGWLDRAAFPYTIHIDHAEGQAPLSGIRGYAVAVDSQPDSEPCSSADRCTDAETDLHGGAGDDSLSIAGLPEGTSYVHAVAVSGSGMRSGVSGHAALHVDVTDPLTTLTGVPSGWSSRPVTLTATATDGGAGMGSAQSAGPYTAIQVDGGVPRTGNGDSVSTTLIASGAHTVAYYARDAAGNVNDGHTSNGDSNSPPSTATVRIDREAPEVSFANSPLPGDPELIQVRVRDSLSGPDRSRGWIGVRRAGSGDRFEALPREPSVAGLSARWDSDAYPPGDYEFLARGFDLAGNAATTTRRANGTAMVLPNPLKIPTTLRADFNGRALARHSCPRHTNRRRCRHSASRVRWAHPRQRLVAFGRGIPFGGRLTAGIGAALAGATIRIVERFPPGAGRVERVSKVRTGTRGAFSIRLPPGPSREVTATFAGTAMLSRSTSRTVRVGVLSSVRLHASSAVATIGGQPIVFRGGVAAGRARSSPAGRSVQLQFRLPGLPWSEFRTLQTDRRGHFRYAYRFSDDDSRGAHFQFRAYVPAQRGWPFEPAGSRPIVVRGR